MVSTGAAQVNLKKFKAGQPAKAEEVNYNFQVLLKAIKEVGDLRILRGSVDSNGNIVAGESFSVRKPEKGKYIINFNDPFTSNPSVVATYKVTGVVTSFMVQINAVSNTSAEIIGVTADGVSFADTNFEFMVLGPR